MRKAMPYLGAALSVLALTWSTAGKAQEPFKDVPQDHWAYQAVTDLQQKKILLGYPDGYFRGKRTLTRYEFAVALERALQNLPGGGVGKTGDTGPAGPAGAQGAQGDPGIQGPPGMTPEEVANLRALTDEFKNELAQMGVDLKAINSRLDALGKDIADIRNQLNRMIRFHGDAFVGYRSDLSRYAFADYSGAGRAASRSHFSNVDAPHDFHLGAHANLAGGVTFDGDMVFSNYLSYRETNGFGNFGNGFVNGGGTTLGGPSAANRNGGAEQVGLYQAKLSIPVGAAGVLELGRIKNQVTPLTYYRPDTDAYFNLPWYDDGNWVHDGFRLSSKFGSATSSFWAGSFSSLTTSSGSFLNRPAVGATVGPFFNGFKPMGLASINQGAQFGNQVAGINVEVPIGRVGALGVTAIDMSVTQNNGFIFDNNGQLINAGNAFVVPGTTNFGNVQVYGAHFKSNPVGGHLVISAEAAKSVTSADFSNGDGSNNEDNNAYLANIGYNSGPINATAGYQYYDPRFNAPGYWNKIGNWYNPTNVQGPFARVAYGLSQAVQLYIGGDYLSGARNRPGFTVGSTVGRATAGVKYNVNKMVNLGAEYEGVFYDISGAATLNGNRSKPIEQYITLNAGLNIAGNTVLKFAYQLLNANNHDGGLEQTSPGGTSNASVFTTQVSVHF